MFSYRSLYVSLRHLWNNFQLFQRLFLLEVFDLFNLTVSSTSNSSQSYFHSFSIITLSLGEFVSRIRLKDGLSLRFDYYRTVHSVYWTLSTFQTERQNCVSIIIIYIRTNYYYSSTREWTSIKSQRTYFQIFFHKYNK